MLVHYEDKMVITMANDYQGNPKEFAIVIPVPTFIKQDQIHVTNNAIIDHLDAHTAPRLVEYYDDDPCRVRVYEALGSLGYLMRINLVGYTLALTFTEITIQIVENDEVLYYFNAARTIIYDIGV